MIPRIALPLSALLLGACTSRAPEPATDAAPFFKDVTYRFNEQPPGTDRTIIGTVRVLGNAAVFDAQPGPCRMIPGLSERTSAYRCDDVLLVADLTTPVVRVTYSTTRVVKENKSTCVRYQTNASGQQVCAQTQTDVVERAVPVTGQLRLTVEP